MMLNRAPFFLSVVAVLAAVGCSSDGKVKVYPVKGRVTYGGKPMVGGGGITFVPLTDQAGKAPGGIIKPDGTYELGTYGENDGSMTGEFRVVIFQETAKEPVPVPDGSPPPPPAASEVPPADRIPLVYANDRDSPLRAKVEPKANEINFDLPRQ